MKNKSIFVLFILSIVTLFLSIGCQTTAQAQKAEESKNGQVNTESVKEEPDGIEGTARYYTKRRNGRRTSSGAIYNPKKLTAAHFTLPFGTRVKVVNLANNKSVIVTVNDRCREQEESFIDLSLEAARQLDMIRQGKAKVLIFIIEEDNQSDEDTSNTQD